MILEQGEGWLRTLTSVTVVATLVGVLSRRDKVQRRWGRNSRPVPIVTLLSTYACAV